MKIKICNQNTNELKKMCLECEKLKKQQLLSDKTRDKETKRLNQIIVSQQKLIQKLRKEIEKKNLQIVKLIYNMIQEK